MYNMMGALRGCHAVKFGSCNNLLSSVHTIFEVSMDAQLGDIDTSYNYKKQTGTWKNRLSSARVVNLWNELNKKTLDSRHCRHISGVQSVCGGCDGPGHPAGGHPAGGHPAGGHPARDFF